LLRVARPKNLKYLSTNFIEKPCAVPYLCGKDEYRRF
jgi:hypothetical protein